MKLTPEIEITLEDNMDLMARYPDNYFDLAICDPPYNIVSQQKRGVGPRIDASGKMNGWNNKKPSAKYFKELFRVSAHQIIWGANNFTLPPTEYFCVWNKKQTVDNFASAEYAWTSQHPAKVFDWSIHKEMQERKKVNGKIHPTQKPVKLYEWLLKNYAKEGDKILDTHLGSGSIAIALHRMNQIEKMNLTLTACELDKDYYEASVKRIREQTSQKTIFDETNINNSQTKI